MRIGNERELMAKERWIVCLVYLGGKVSGKKCGVNSVLICKVMHL